MRNLALTLTLLNFVAAAFPAQVQAAMWNPPMGMVWHMPGNCSVVGGAEAFMQGCYFGPAGSKENAGAAFFRVCGVVREPRPFLVLDYERGIYTFSPEEGAATESGKLSSADDFSVDPDPFYMRVLQRKGPCDGGNRPI